MARSKKVELAAGLGQKLWQWMQMAAALAVAKKDEFELRQQLATELGFDKKKLEGSETIEIDGGYKVKSVKDQSYKLTNANGETMALLNAIGAIRPDIAAALVKWEPQLSESTYKKELLLAIEDIEKESMNLNPPVSVRTLLAAALTIKPGATQLEVIPPAIEAKQE